MTEKIGRQCRIAPSDNRALNAKSWSEKSKIYAVKINVGDVNGYQLVGQKSAVESAKKWISKCKWKLPLTMITFSVIQIFFHLIGPAALTYQTLAFSPVRVYELWRFLTYSLLHAGFAHLVINIILQLVIACPLETELSHFQVVLVYTGGVLAGSFAASVSQDSSLMVGASSGVYALLTSHISHICLNFSTISHRLHRIIFVSFLVGSDIAYAIIHCLINGNKEPKVHINAHIAGALSGVLLGFACYGSRRHESAKFKIVWWLSVTCSFGLTFLVIIINISRGS